MSTSIVSSRIYWLSLTSLKFRIPIWNRVCLQETNMFATASAGIDDMLAVVWGGVGVGQIGKSNVSRSDVDCSRNLCSFFFFLK